MEENRLKINGFFSISAFFVATQFFFTLSFMNILLAIILVVVYLLFIQDAYRSHLLRYIGIDLLIAGSINSLTILIRFKNTFHKSLWFEKVELNLHTTCFCKISSSNFAFVTKHMRAKLLQVATAPFVPRGHSNDKWHFLFVGTFLNPRARPPCDILTFLLQK